MTIDTVAILERVTSRAYGWSVTTAAPQAVLEAVAAHQSAVTALDDGLLAYELEDGERRRILKHTQAVEDALRDGKMPPAAKVPSLEALEVKHAAILAALEAFVQEAASRADRVAQEHYAQWRNEAVERLQDCAATVAELVPQTRRAIADWGSAAQLVARLDRNWAPRTNRIDEVGVVQAVDAWISRAAVDSTQMHQNLERDALTLRDFTAVPVIAEYDPAGAPEQFSEAFLAEQSPYVRDDLRARMAGTPKASEPSPAGWLVGGL